MSQANSENIPASKCHSAECVLAPTCLLIEKVQLPTFLSSRHATVLAVLMLCRPGCSGSCFDSEPVTNRDLLNSCAMSRDCRYSAWATNEAFYPSRCSLSGDYSVEEEEVPISESMIAAVPKLKTINGIPIHLGYRWLEWG